MDSHSIDVTIKYIYFVMYLEEMSRVLVKQMQICNDLSERLLEINFSLLPICHFSLTEFENRCISLTTVA